MKYVMSMAANKEHLKEMIMSDKEMTDMEKLHDVFAVDREEVKNRFPQLYCAILAVLINGKKADIDLWGSTFVTNFDVPERERYEQAIKRYAQETGDDSLYILEEAYWKNGYRDKDMNSLHMKFDHDLSEFWKIFDSITGV